MLMSRAGGSLCQETWINGIHCSFCQLLIEQNIGNGTIIFVDMDFLLGVEWAIFVNWPTSRPRASFLTIYIGVFLLPLLGLGVPPVLRLSGR
jgi:hypothetical protein